MLTACVGHMAGRCWELLCLCLMEGAGFPGAILTLSPGTNLIIHLS